MLKAEPKGGPAGVIRRVVGAVDCGVGTAGHGAGIKDKGLVEEINADAGFGKEALLGIRAGNQPQELPAGMAKDTHAGGRHMYIIIRERGIETEISHWTVGANIAGSEGDVPSMRG